MSNDFCQLGKYHPPMSWWKASGEPESHATTSMLIDQIYAHIRFRASFYTWSFWLHFEVPPETSYFLFLDFCCVSNFSIFFSFFFFLTAFLSRGSCMLWLTTSPRWLSAAMVCSVQSSSSSSCCSLSSSPSLSASGGWTNSWAFSCLGFISCSWLSASSWRTKWSSVLSPSSGKCWFLRKKKKKSYRCLFIQYIYIYRNEMKW